MSISASVLAPILLSALHPGPVGQEPEPDFLEHRVEAIAKEALLREGIGGLAVSASVGSDTLISGGWGVIASGARVDADTRFRAGSMLEQLANVAAVRLAREGMLSLEDPLEKHLPTVKWEGEPVTLMHLLSHTSGIPASDVVLPPNWKGTTDELHARIAAVPLETSPGDCFSYSDTNHLLVGQVIEKVAGSSLEEVLQRAIFEPIGMENTGFVAEDAPPCLDTPSVQEVSGEQEALGYAAFGARGFCTDSRDLLALQGALTRGEDGLEEVFVRMTEPRRLADGSTTSNGFGIGTTTLNEFDGYSYGGGACGYRAHVATYPELDLTVVVLARGSDAPVGRVARRIARAIFDLPEPGIHDRPLPEALQKLFKGQYQIGCDRVEIRAAGEGIVFVSAERELALLYQGARHAFVAEEDPEVRLSFVVEEERARHFVLEEGGSRTIAQRMESRSSH